MTYAIPSTTGSTLLDYGWRHASTSPKPKGEQLRASRGAEFALDFDLEEEPVVLRLLSTLAWPGWPVRSSPLVATCRLLVSDRQHGARDATPELGHLPSIAAKGPATVLRELMASLSLNKTQAAQVVGVSRPTIYEWLDGKEPRVDNVQRLLEAVSALAASGVTAREPIMAKFVGMTISGSEPSLIDLLCREPLDVREISVAVARVRAQERIASEELHQEGERLAALGYETGDARKRKSRIANIVALRDPRPR